MAALCATAMAGPSFLSARVATGKSAAKEESGNFFDFLNKALDKKSLSELDPILQKVAGKESKIPARKLPTKKPGKK